MADDQAIDGPAMEDLQGRLFAGNQNPSRDGEDAAKRIASARQMALNAFLCPFGAGGDLKDRTILAILVVICVVVPGYLILLPVPAPSVNSSVPFAPIKVPTEGATVLAYEIEFSDFDVEGMALTGAKVYCADNGTLLQDIRGAYLASTFHPRSIPAPTPEELWRGTLKLPHSRLTVFLALPNATGLSALRHQFEFSWRGASYSAAGPLVACQERTIPVIGPPLGGDQWIAMETTIATSHHMRDQVTIGNVTRCCQRYAVDYMLMKSDMSYFTDSSSVNSNWYGYGADYLAVADGIVTQVVDGIWENTPPNTNANLTFDQAGGNMVIIDIGGDNYAQYAHMIPGSKTVSVGDRVTKGQVLGKMGNAGSSNAPHLHFQVGSDPYSILASEGLPFLLERFQVDGLLIADPNTGPVDLLLYEPPQEFSCSWFGNYEWMDHGADGP
jgi:hypothetical protein